MLNLVKAFLFYPLINCVNVTTEFHPVSQKPKVI